MKYLPGDGLDISAGYVAHDIIRAQSLAAGMVSPVSVDSASDTFLPSDFL